MSPGSDPRLSAIPGRLDDRILHALEGLPGRIAFSGLRRVLGAHPESLARALRRLEREGLVERVDGGYRVLSDGRRSIEELTADLRTIAQVELPAGISAESLFGRLAGRWFGSLRWMGVVERNDGRLLAWARRDGNGHVLLGVDRGNLRVLVPASDDRDDVAEAEEVAYELLLHAVEALRPAALRPAPSSGAVTYLASDLPAHGFRGPDN